MSQQMKSNLLIPFLCFDFTVENFKFGNFSKFRLFQINCLMKIFFGNLDKSRLYIKVKKLCIFKNILSFKNIRFLLNELTILDLLIYFL